MKAFLKRLVVSSFLFLAFWGFTVGVDVLGVRIGRECELAIVGAAAGLWLRYAKRVFTVVGRWAEFGGAETASRRLDQ